MKVLITRPAQQAESLLSRLKELEIEAARLPLLVIEGIAETQAQTDQILHLDTYSGVIVISPNAARYGMELIDRYWPMLPIGMQWLANGPGTARVMADWPLAVQTPESGSTSEDLLEIPRLKHVQDEKWLLIRGEGGRDLIKQELTNRGAQVEYLESYRRRMPKLPLSLVQDQLNGVDVVVITSAEALDNLYELTDGKPVTQALMVVSSQRMLDIAKEKGWPKLHLARGADDQSIIECLQQLKDQCIING